ncbi:hypothetical protein ABMA27_003365 [Loxostege sticticalis]|uniref:Myb/SANT-like DNA-binding domain-containing protein n=1 Tax=Loxostege sticticalis TaxID=481309 RepID=A0ABR3HSV9_LOXSC
MLVVIKDETTGRDISINLTIEQYQRAQRDPVYVQELITTYDQNLNSLDRGSQSAVVPDQTSQNTYEENDLSLPLESINNEGNEVSLPLESINNEGNEENSQSTLFIWSDSCILLLLTLYEEKKDEFATKRHKKIFADIAKKMHDTNPEYIMTGSQCQSKINSLKKTYKKIFDHNTTSGNDRVTWPYFDRMNEIFGQTGWANPLATASEAGPTDTPPTNKEKPPKHKMDLIFDDYFKTKKKL